MNVQRIHDLLAPICHPHGIVFEAVRAADRNEAYLVFRKRYPKGLAGPDNAAECGMKRQLLKPEPLDSDYEVLAYMAVDMIERAVAQAGPAWPHISMATRAVFDVLPYREPAWPTGMTIESLIAAIDAVRTDGFEVRDSRHLYLTETDWNAVKAECIASGMTAPSLAPYEAPTMPPGAVGTFYGCPVFIAHTNSFQCDTHRVPLEREERLRWMDATGLRS